MIEHFSDEYSPQKFYESREEQFAKSVWCLLVALEERLGETTARSDPWYGQDFLRVEKECKKVLGINE